VNQSFCGENLNQSRIRVAILVCSRVVGGHEYQVAALAQSLAAHVSVSVYINQPDHASLFNSSELKVCLKEGQLLRPGTVLIQYLDGWRRRNVIRSLVESYDYVIVSAGAVEAAIAAGVALRGYKPMSMYLPFFYDRVPVWGWTGHLYNCILARSCRLYDRIITINRIQAYVIRAFSGVSTFVVPNKIREVQRPVEQGPPRLVFVGRLDQQKRVDELMHWLDSEANPVRELVLIGDGPLRQQLANQALTLTFLNCSFLGWRGPEEQDRLIRSNDILVLNSLLEGEPLVIREARFRSMKIVARDIIGVRGVTTCSERYTSQDELIDLLLKFSNPNFPKYASPYGSMANESNYKRASSIFKLYNLISRNLPSII
jgi:glycosyltransferase involved in cell wall biosynthesis